MKDSKVILISAKARHGKDCVAGMLADEITKDHRDVLVIHFADVLKSICESSYGWVRGDKGPVGRTILQTIGTRYREINEDVWANIVHEIAQSCPEKYVLVPDCRYRNEAGVFRDMDHCVIRVIRPNFDNGLTPEQKCHMSETNMDDYPYDYIVKNDGTIDDLQTKIAILYKKLR